MTQPEVQPLRGLRYTPAAGDPAGLLAPPYDVISPALQATLDDPPDLGVEAGERAGQAHADVEVAMVHRAGFDGDRRRLTGKLRATEPRHASDHGMARQGIPKS